MVELMQHSGISVNVPRIYWSLLNLGVNGFMVVDIARHVIRDMFILVA